MAAHFSPIAVMGFVLAVLAGFTAALAGFGTRLGFWEFPAGIAILRWAAYGGIAATVISLIGAVLTSRGAGRRGFALSIVGILMGIVIVGIPLTYWRAAHRVPAINDITTDTDHPPMFVAILPLRKNVPTPSSYAGSEIAAQQKRAYPDIIPLLLPAPPDQAFARAQEAARSLGWRIIDTNQREGRIEATDTTLWFGFKDDIVVRIIAVDSGSRVDVRSVSRVGKSDLGTNARRIRAYFKKLKT
jgi:uncharacterized protein (DUF1499 family)